MNNAVAERLSYEPLGYLFETVHKVLPHLDIILIFIIVISITIIIIIIINSYCSAKDHRIVIIVFII